MKSNKKKPRQRNRPRNKANRGKESVSVAEEQNTSQVKDSIPERSVSDTVIQETTAANRKDTVQKTVHLKDKSPATPVNDIQQEKCSNNIDANTNNNNNNSKSSAKMPKPDAFIRSLQQQMETMMLSDENKGLPQTIMNNLQKSLVQTPISDVESSDDEDEYIEYIYKPRKYFLTMLCNWCKKDLTEDPNLTPCKECKLSYYCGVEHLRADHEKHRSICRAIVKLARQCDGHIFHKCGEFTSEQFRSYRLINIHNIEGILNRTLDATERELLLFPRICFNPKCREYRWKKLQDCNECGMIAYCKQSKESLSNEESLTACKEEFTVQQHKNWCKSYSLFKRIIMRQEKCGGRLEPKLPIKILKELPVMAFNTHDIYQKLNLNIKDDCEYAVLTQISTVPLTSWYASKLTNQIQQQSTSATFTIHLIGAEFDFEIDVLNKWELFFLHITPNVQQLNIVFVGPELNSNGRISLDQLKKTKCCRVCRQMQRNVNYYFESKLYHEYCNQKGPPSATASSFIQPNIVCFFNAGLYRATGYQWEDTWPETILKASQLKVPIVVTAYTEYEMPLDMARLVQESSRPLNVILPPIMNPFTSIKPERNFISDHEAPLIFKNYYCFIVE